MSRHDLMTTRYGEFLDILSLRAVDMGAARIVKHVTDYWEATSLR